ncbi:hypothetical protein MASR2M78_31470 [Treponema sp.]
MFFIMCLLFSFVHTNMYAQEAIHSDTNLRYDFQALNGDINRPYLNYKTLSDSEWDGIEQWKYYGPELFTSYNSSAPYGMNDGALWQGRGLNTSLTGGIRYNAYGIEATFKPQITFSQNADFKIMPSGYSSPYGYIWAYGTDAGADAPQRFGDEALYGYSWGDSELRYTWKNATIGFGTQSPWLGPGRINAIMHSNNAPPYPKLDLGLRRTELSLWGWYAGDIEARLWAGYLSESDYFDNNPDNNHNLISALSLAYAPSFLPGLTLAANRSYLAPWEAESAASLGSLFFVNLDQGGAQDVWDQRASLSASYLLPSAGIEIYGELGINDYGPSFFGYLRYPFHSMVYLGGLRKTFEFKKYPEVRGELLFEWCNLELSQDFQFQWPATFYMHHQMVQGYTNDGQWLGAGIGTGGNSQFLGYKLYHEKGSSEVFIQRTNPDNDFLYRLTIMDENSSYISRNKDFRTDTAFRFKTRYYFSNQISINTGLILLLIQNRLYDSVGCQKQTMNMALELRPALNILYEKY